MPLAVDDLHLVLRILPAREWRALGDDDLEARGQNAPDLGGFDPADVQKPALRFLGIVEQGRALVGQLQSVEQVRLRRVQRAGERQILNLETGIVRRLIHKGESLGKERPCGIGQRKGVDGRCGQKNHAGDEARAGRPVGDGVGPRKPGSRSRAPARGLRGTLAATLVGEAAPS